ncbi:MULTISPECIES: acyl-CoA carboxylase subunit beta [unclassified Nocardioides]|uniref:acyl-CoA carboxylase subunit beta n=1 Tax=unclassified Nocardioides TaxID=2615069 RepID=UPI00005701CC|nr:MULTISPECIES: acyl-CoA carboxylase subunit beta [unclassified Nocardioides]ABL83633.1 Propionyl-CoA carboxylase [Nocardioides sp. JS614]
MTNHLQTGPSASRRELERRLSDAVPEPRGGRRRTALERAQALCDDGSFAPTGALRQSTSRNADKLHDGDGVVTGFGTVDGRPVAVVSHEFSHSGGSIGSGFALKVADLQDRAISLRMPIVYLNDSGGARINEGIDSLDGCGQMFRRNVRAKGLVPQVSVILGPCAGAAAYSPALTDWTIMVRGTSHMFLTGPDVVRAAIGEEVSSADLGGAELHTIRSGVAHLAVDTEEEAFDRVRELLSFVPTNSADELPLTAPCEPAPQHAREIATVVPRRGSEVFDMHRLVRAVVDGSESFEMMPDYGTSVITAFARLGGVPVGIVASQPHRRGGILEITSSRKIARFVRFCGRFHLPIVTFVDVPGFMPGAAQESGGIIAEGAEVLDAYVDADSPRLTVVARKAYGGAFIAMGSKSLGADFAWAYPDAELAVMGPGGAVNILHRRELAAAEDPELLRARLAEEYRETVTRPFAAAEAGIIDDIIRPEDTRATLLAALRLWHPSAAAAPAKRLVEASNEAASSSRTGAA